MKYIYLGGGRKGKEGKERKGKGREGIGIRYKIWMGRVIILWK